MSFGAFDDGMWGACMDHGRAFVFRRLQSSIFSRVRVGLMCVRSSISKYYGVCMNLRTRPRNEHC